MSADMGAVSSVLQLEAYMCAGFLTGTAAPSFVETAFNSLIPDINAIGAFINKQTGGKLSYLVNTLLAGSAGMASFALLVCMQQLLMN